MNKRARLVTILAVAFVVLSAAFVLIIQINNNRNRKNAETYSQMIQPLEMELDSLEKELTALERAENRELARIATLNPLFTDLTPDIMTVILPALQPLGCSASLLLSPEQMPGMNGNITLEQFHQLLDCGWEYCWYYNGKEEINEWYRKMQETISLYGLAAPKTVYCAANGYKTALDETLRGMGFENVIHHGEAGLNLYNTQPESSGIWRIGTMDTALASETALESALYQIVDAHANIVFSISSSGNGALLWPNIGYIVDNYLAPSVKSGVLALCGAVGARAIQEENVRREAAAAAGHGLEYIATQQKIEALRQKIEALQDEYRTKH